MSEEQEGCRVRDLRVDGPELRFAVDVAGESHEIWIRTSEKDVVPRADAALALAHVVAMTVPGPLRFEAPVDRELAGRLDEVAAAMDSFKRGGSWKSGRPLCNRPRIIAPYEASFSAELSGRGVASFFSGGVDSFSNLKRLEDLDALVYIAGFDRPAGPGRDDEHAEVKELVATVAGRIGAAVVSVETNVRELYRDRLAGPAWGGHVLGAATRLLAPRFRRLHVAASQAYPSYRANSSHPSLDHLWDADGLRLIHEGPELLRTEKIELIADDPVAQRLLRVCWVAGGASNCCRCEKCLRTMVPLAVLGRLEAFSAFPLPLDLNAVAAMAPANLPEVDYWRENLDLAVSQGADAELVDAIRSCLANSVPAFAAPEPSQPATHSPEWASGRDVHRTLFMPPQLHAALDGRHAVFLIGGYDGSGNYGDIAQLEAALALLAPLGPEVAAVPVIDLRYVDNHRAAGLVGSPSFDPGLPLVFSLGGAESAAAATAAGLVPATLPGSMRTAGTYLCGGGYLNQRWAARVLTMVAAVDVLAARAGIRARPKLSSGLQIDPGWAAAVTPVVRDLLAEFAPLGVRDELSVLGGTELAGRGGAVLTGDDAIGALSRTLDGGEPVPRSNGEAMRVNIHLCPEPWVTDDPARLLSFFAELLVRIGEKAGRPVEVQPLIAYEDLRFSERPALTRFCAELGRARGIEVAGEPLLLRPATLPSHAAELCRAQLSIATSYHVSLTNLMLGVPAALLEDSPYYSQKGAGLRDEFSLDPAFSVDPSGSPQDAASAIVAAVGESHLRRRLVESRERAVSRRAEVEDRLRSELEGSFADAPAHGSKQGIHHEDYEALLSAHQRIAAELDTARSSVEWHEERLRDITESASWRFTAPLRRGKSLMGRSEPPATR
jgi:hypothetical protein